MVFSSLKFRNGYKLLNHFFASIHFIRKSNYVNHGHDYEQKKNFALKFDVYVSTTFSEREVKENNPISSKLCIQFSKYKMRTQTIPTFMNLLCYYYRYI